MRKSVSGNEYIFIVDNGCIVRPSMEVADWFSQVIDFEENKGCHYISVISRFRPSQTYLERHPEYISLAINPLSDSEATVLYNRYARTLKIDHDEKHEEIISSLNGIPAQVYYAVEYVHRFGISQAIRNIDNIIDYGDKPVLRLVSMVKEKGTACFDLFVLLCNLKTTSYNMIYRIAGNTEDVNKNLEYFFVLGIFSLFGDSKEYIEVNNALTDYIHRSRMKMKKDYQDKLQQSVERFVDKHETDTEFSDLSMLYHDIKGALLEGKELGESYYLPSFVLNSIAELYNLGKYRPIVTLVDKMLKDSSRYDNSTVREFMYWLCLSLARLSNKRFENEVGFFGISAEYYFLKGFYYRIAKQLDDAEKCFLEALDKSPGHQRAKRELVNVYIMKGDFTKGVNMAKENFNRQKTNPFHVQAYFICLIQEHSSNISAVQDDLDQLMKLIKQLSDPRAKSIQVTMAGEYAYFVEKNKKRAIEILEDSVSASRNTFSCKVLEDIYRREKMKEDKNRIHTKMLELMNNY